MSSGGCEKERLKAPLLVCTGCRDGTPGPGGLMNSRRPFLPVLEAGSKNRTLGHAADEAASGGSSLAGSTTAIFSVSSSHD